MVNLVGCENFGIYERSAGDLKLIGEFPSHPSPIKVLPAGSGFVADIFKASGPWIAGRDPLPASPVPDNVTAVIPLRLGSDLSGAVVLFSLLPQKGGTYGDVDLELMDLLTTHAATALFVSRA